MKKVNFQVLRVAACMGVFVSHVGAHLQLQGSLGKLTALGGMGVYLFFIISGYLCFASFDRKRTKLFPYYMKRLARILPVYYTVILVQFVLHTWIWCDVPPDETHLGWLRYVLCVNQAVPAEDGFWTNLNATWSIGVFLFFYLLAPFLHRIIKNANVALIGWLFSYFAPYYLGMMIGDYFKIGNFVQYFLFGIALYYIEKEKSTGKFAALYIANLLFSTVLQSNQTINAWVMIFGLLVISSSSWAVKNPYLSKAINLTDEYSYAIYLVHATVLECVAYWELSYVQAGKLPVLAMIVTGTVAGVVLVHHMIEKPVYAFVSKRVTEG